MAVTDTYHLLQDPPLALGCCSGMETLPLPQVPPGSPGGTLSPQGNQGDGKHCATHPSQSRRGQWTQLGSARGNLHGPPK